MNRIIIIIMLLFLCVGCNNQKEIVIDDLEEKVLVTAPADTVIELYNDDNIMSLGMFNNTNKIKVKETSYKLKTLDLFGTYKVYPSNSDIYDYGYFYQAWYKYRDLGYKIGYKIKFTLDNTEEIEWQILSATDNDASTPYLYVYLYDDIYHRNESWYSHETIDREDSLFTTIKFQGSHQCERITSDIEVTAFTYNGLDDFNSEGKYIGKTGYTMYINNIK